jgi:predicted dehydrogenase
MKTVIAGLGSIGRRHLRNLVSLGEKDVILYRKNLSTLEDKELDGFPVVYDIDDALKERPDAIIISNPTSMHLEVAIPAASAGCSIFMEKPISDSLNGLDQLKKALEFGGGKFFTGFQYRFHPTLIKAHQLLERGFIGNPVSVQSHWGEYLPDWHPWEDYKVSYAARPDLGGGVVLTLSHPFDYLSWLMGEPEFQWADVRTRGDLGISVDDVADVCLKFKNGAIGMVHLNYLQKPTSHHLEIVGSAGNMKWDNSDGILYVYKNSENKIEIYKVPDGYERNHMYLEEMKHFIEIVNDRAKSRCTLDDGITALYIAMQVLEKGKQ